MKNRRTTLSRAPAQAGAAYLFGIGSISQNNFSMPALLLSLGVVNLFRQGRAR